MKNFCRSKLPFKRYWLLKFDYYRIMRLLTNYLRISFERKLKSTNGFQIRDQLDETIQNMYKTQKNVCYSNYGKVWNC